MVKYPTLLIFGAGGHAKWAASIATLSGMIPRLVDQIEEAGVLTSAPACAAHIGIGDNAVRETLFCDISARRPDFTWPAVIHPSAVICGNVEDGALVLPMAVIGPGASVGKGCVLYTHSVCEHDSALLSHSSLAPGAQLGGRVTIGKRAFIGIGASVRQGAKICDDAVIGAGAVVVSHIEKPGVYVGNPARFLKPAVQGSALQPIGQSCADVPSTPANQPAAEPLFPPTSRRASLSG